MNIKILDNNLTLTSLDKFLQEIMVPYFTDQTKNTPSGIVEYLRSNSNSNLLDLVSLTFQVIATKDVMQLFSNYKNFNVFQWNLPKVNGTNDFIVRDVKNAVLSNTQDSNPWRNQDWGQILLNNEWKDLQYQAIKNSLQSYESAVEQGVSFKEAESILPYGLVENTFYVNGTIKDWINFLQMSVKSQLVAEEQDVIENLRSLLKSGSLVTVGLIN